MTSPVLHRTAPRRASHGIRAHRQKLLAAHLAAREWPEHGYRTQKGAPGVTGFEACLGKIPSCGALTSSTGTHSRLCEKLPGLFECLVPVQRAHSATPADARTYVQVATAMTSRQTVRVLSLTRDAPFRLPEPLRLCHCKPTQELADARTQRACRPDSKWPRTPSDRHAVLHPCGRKPSSQSPFDALAMALPTASM